MASCWMYYLLDDEMQAQGDLLGRLQDHIYRDFGFISVFPGVDSRTASRFDGLLRVSDA